MSPRIRGVLIGGVIGGLLSAIPFLNLGNCICCLWVLVGSAIAAAVHIKGSPEVVSKGAGTVTGLISAAPMTALMLLVGIPLGLLGNAAMIGMFAGMVDDPAIQDQLMAQMGQSTVQTIVSGIVNTIVFGIIAAGFGALGGLIGTAIFEKRPPQYPM